MGSSALRYSGAGVRVGRSPLLKLQSDERLVHMVRRGNQGAFEVLVARYHARLLSFCRHMLGSREDAEDVLQDVLTASYNAMLADDRPINVRPWLYRIARNRCLNHLRRNRAVGVDSMDIHLAEHGATTADKVHEREEFRQLLHDIRDLPETQRTALVLREMDALSYEQIAEAMETTVSSVKSLLVRARVSLTEAAEARLLSCEEVREELAEIAEGMRRKQSASVRRHVKNCSRCEVFQGEMRKSSRALAALAPIGPLAFFHKLLFAHAASHTAGSAGIAGAAGAGGAGAAGAGAAGAGAAGAAAGGAGSAGLVTAGVGAVATKAAAGIAAAALVTAGTVAIDHTAQHQRTGPPSSVIVQRSLATGLQAAVSGSHLGGSVGAGPGLSTPVVSSKIATAVSGHVAQSVVGAGSTVSQSSHATKDATTRTGTVQKTDATMKSQPAQAVTPPVTNLQSAPASGSTGSGGIGSGGTGSGGIGSGSTGSGLNPSGGAGLGPTGATTTTSTASSTSTTTSTATTSSTAPTTSTPASASTGGSTTVGTTTGSTTTSASTGTSTTSTVTSPDTTATETTPTATATTPTATGTTTSATTTSTTSSVTGTATSPAATTTSAPATTTPATTSTAAATVTNPSAPTTGTVTTPAG